MTTIRERVNQFVAPVVTRTREVIGRVRGLGSLAPATASSIDRTEPDYGWWDKFFYGKQAGFEFASLFARAIVEIITSWVFGKRLDAQLVEREDIPDDTRAYTNSVVKKFLRRNQALLTHVTQKLYGLGNQYVVVNVDGSLSVPSPDQVKVNYDPLDYRRVMGYTITSTLDDATVTDAYTPDERVITIKWKDTKKPVETQTYSNLIGRLPIVHFANDRSGNETHGRPIFEALWHLFSRYNKIMTKALNGAELLSDPVPVFEGLEDMDETITVNGEPDPNNADNSIINFAKLKVILLGKGGKFRFASPGNGFTTDARNMLKGLFLLILDFTRIPEVIWGNELSGARNTSIEQMQTFYAYVESRRVLLEGEGTDDEMVFEPRGGLLALVDIYLRMKALTDTGVTIAPVEMLWGELSQRDETKLFGWTQWALAQGLITPETALEQADFSGVDPAIEVAAAAEANAAAPDPFEDGADDDEALMPDLEDAA